MGKTAFVILGRISVIEMFYQDLTSLNASAKNQPTDFWGQLILTFEA